MLQKRQNGKSISFINDHDLTMGLAEIFGLFILPAVIILLSLALFILFKEEGE